MFNKFACISQKRLVTPLILSYWQVLLSVLLVVLSIAIQHCGVAAHTPIPKPEVKQVSILDLFKEDPTLKAQLEESLAKKGKKVPKKTPKTEAEPASGGKV